MRIPRKLPAGSSPFADEWNAMVDALKASQMQGGAGIQFKVTPFGTVPAVSQQRRAAAVPGGDASPVERFRLKSVQGDYITCRTWDGTTEGGADVKIAKPPKLRRSIASESIEGTTVSYSYGTRTNNLDGKRDATAGGVTITEIVMPVYIVNDEIFAAKPLRGTDVVVSSVELEYLDINVDGRAWGMVG